MPKPSRPNRLSAHAERTLQALAAEGLGSILSVGGALGLQHYFEYRTTHDVDAWWEPHATAEDRARVLRTIEEALKPDGEVRIREWGDVASVDLRVGGKTIFSFQIAARSAQLAPTTLIPWIDVRLDSFDDLVASKMVALVERGAPRDLRDIHALCQAGLTDPSGCWRLWKQRQQAAGNDVDPHRARLAIETHLTRISQHRPLERIDDPAEREQAEQVRTWFTKELLNALLD